MVKDSANDGRRDGRQQSRLVHVNWSIKSPQCRVIQDEGGQPRLMPTRDAIAYAEEKGLDLVEIGYDKANRVSICRICDYGKYQYEKKRREKEQKRAAKAGQVDVKSVQISVATDSADLDRFESRVLEFLAEGDNVRISLRMRNRREMANVEFAKQALKGFVQRFEGKAALASGPAVAGREITCVLRKA